MSEPTNLGEPFTINQDGALITFDGKFVFAGPNFTERVRVLFNAAHGLNNEQIEKWLPHLPILAQMLKMLSIQADAVAWGSRQDGIEIWCDSYGSEEKTWRVDGASFQAMDVGVFHETPMLALVTAYCDINQLPAKLAEHEFFRKIISEAEIAILRGRNQSL